MTVASNTGRPAWDIADPIALHAELCRRFPGEQLDPPGIQRVVLEPDALRHLPHTLRHLGATRTLLVVDPTPIRRAGVDLKEHARTLTASAGPVEVLELVPVHGHTSADIQAAERVRDALSPGVAVVAVGSGTVNDVAKHGCHLYDEANDGPPVAFITCPTANSMTGYTSNTAAILVAGAKRTLRSRHPTVVLADLVTLAEAPVAMTRAGVGDLCARFVAYADWYLGHRLGLIDRYSLAPLALLDDLECTLRTVPPDLQGNVQAAEQLQRALGLAGLAQSVMGMSAPVSGLEHVMSHVLDMTADEVREPVRLHGAQVGVASIMVAAAYECLLAGDEPRHLAGRLADLGGPRAHEQIASAFPGQPATAAECWRDYARKVATWQAHQTELTDLEAHWSAVTRTIAELVRPAAFIRDILQRVGAPTDFHELDPPLGDARARFAVLHGHLVRERFNLGDFLALLGWLQPALYDRLQDRISAS